MKCYDCGGEIASGTDKCPSCGCPAGRDEAAGCLGARLLTAQLESESALDQLGKARSAMFAAALLALAAIYALSVVGDYTAPKQDSRAAADDRSSGKSYSNANAAKPRAGIPIPEA